MAARQAVAKRAPFGTVNAVISEDDQRLRSVTDRPEIQAAFGTTRWRPAIVDTRKLVAFQKIITLEGIDDRVSGDLDEASLLQLCLPSQQSIAMPHATQDAVPHQYTLSSVNPNLRVIGSGAGPAMIPGPGGVGTIPVFAVSIFAHVPASYVAVARYHGRCFLRDGYHRVAGLLRRGVHEVPCILMEVESFAEVTGGTPGMFGDGVLSSDCPPMVSDFWDDSVSRETKRVTMRKVVRVRPDELLVPK